MPDLDIFVILADLLRMIYCISAQQRLCVCLFRKYNPSPEYYYFVLC